MSPPSRAKRFITRQGTAVTELAICLPLLVLITLGTVEACSMLYLQQKLETAAYEGARVGCVPDADGTNVKYQCKLLLDSQGVKNHTVTLDPANPSSATDGQFFTVTVTAPCDDNSLIGGWFYMGRELTGEVALTRD